RIEPGVLLVSRQEGTSRHSLILYSDQKKAEEERDSQTARGQGPFRTLSRFGLTRKQDASHPLPEKPESPRKANGRCCQWATQHGEGQPCSCYDGTSRRF